MNTTKRLIEQLQNLTGKRVILKENSSINDPRVEQVISILQSMEVDGETMEYILRQVGMEEQMANQLVHNPKEYAASTSKV